ncbi:carbohydrate ABC transporter substrate-binding protein (plasmid) [Peteryoungia desertarenae]|uniref:Probable sugar-binding periplasmic protein n=1 Tax=Peteryoungia desertarenae TaxID=1813451 RepID=A0ABX6QSL1_9HYPH|nr:ABC transporter substrate-binding protein [Peteryoungia desertarenae]QLF71603.1 carbohydrate ABC transporter substrate-binding protein [Peteryoungia desertarenae]
MLNLMPHRLALCLFMLFQTVGQQPEAADLMTHWNSKGETAALQEISSAVTRRGGTMTVVHMPTSVELRKTFMRLYGDGRPPAALHWYQDGDTKHFIELGMFSEINALTPTSGWSDVLAPVVLDRISHKGKIHFVPVGVHVENWLWVNKAVLADHGLALPKSWADIVATARRLKEQGIEPLVVTDDDWVRAILLRAVLADLIGPPDKANQRPDWQAVLQHPRLKEVVQTLVDLNPLLSRDKSKRSWSEGASDLIEGKAAFYLMGDWLKGELPPVGDNRRDQIACLVPPGNDWLLTVVVDSLAFPPSANPEIRMAQAQIIAATMDPKVQVAFSNIKGSIPPRLDTETGDLDDCARLALFKIADPAVSTYQLEPHTDSPTAAVRFWMALDDALWQPGITVDEVLATLRRVEAESR